MKKYPKLRGGRRSFYVILFILFSILVTSALCMQSPEPSQQTSSLSTNAIQDSIFALQDTIKNIEYRISEELQIQKLYKLITQVSSIVNEDERQQLAKAVYTYGKQYSIDPLLLLSIIKIESNFRKTVTGYGNCYGYFQINLNVHKVSKNFKNDVNEQTKKACQIFSYYYKLYNGNLNKTLNGYNGNASSKNKYAEKILRVYNNYKLVYKGI